MLFNRDDDPYLDLSNSDLGLDNQAPLPPMTDYQVKCSKFGLTLSYIPSIRKYYINSWEVQLCMPIVVLFIIFSSYFFFLFGEYPHCPKLNPLIVIIVTIFLGLFVASYILVILEGPGYLPFYYPYRNPNKKTGQKDYLSGIVTTDEQRIYLKNQPEVPRTIYSRDCRRIVIRPDHLCGWTTVFIGKRNHKLFFLFTMWGSLYIFTFIACSVMTIINISIDDEHILLLIGCMLYGIFGLSFGLMTTIFLCNMLCEVSKNMTAFEDNKRGENIWKKKNCCDNWEEICGPKDEWFLWPWPVPAFKDIDDYYLVSSIPSNHSLL